MDYFGDHLILDAFGCKVDLWDLNVLSENLITICARAKMTPIGPPHVFKYSGVNPMDIGTTGIQILAESHLSCHTFPLRGEFLTLDLYTCRKLDNIDQILADIVALFKVEHVNYKVLKRGIGFTRDENNDTWGGI